MLSLQQQAKWHVSTALTPGPSYTNMTHQTVVMLAEAREKQLDVQTLSLRFTSDQ